MNEPSNTDNDMDSGMPARAAWTAASLPAAAPVSGETTSS